MTPIARLDRDVHGTGSQYDSSSQASPWGCHVRFRIPLPDHLHELNVHHNNHASLAACTKGPPQLVYVGVYQRRPVLGDLHIG